MRFPVKFMAAFLSISSVLLLVIGSSRAGSSIPEFRTSSGQESALVEQDAKTGDEAIEDAMKKLKSASRSVRRALRSKDVVGALAWVGKAQLALVESKMFVPDAASELTGKAKTALEQDYRLRVIAVLEQWIVIEKALLQGDTEAASVAMKKVSELKKSGHQKHKVDD
ncbi:MAG: hypothetical protein AAEJ04_01390 [Planctomycetota bacterium]